jgi:hypothetical protein
MHREYLTSERLKALFKSNFELANYAMRLARYKIMAGHEVNVDELLDEVQLHPHRYTIEELEKMGAEAKEKRQETEASERGERYHQERGERNQER